VGILPTVGGKVSMIRYGATVGVDVNGVTVGESVNGTLVVPSVKGEDDGDGVSTTTVVVGDAGGVVVVDTTSSDGDDALFSSLATLFAVLDPLEEDDDVSSSLLSGSTIPNVIPTINNITTKVIPMRTLIRGLLVPVAPDDGEEEDLGSSAWKSGSSFP